MTDRRSPATGKKRLPTAHAETQSERDEALRRLQQAQADLAAAVLELQTQREQQTRAESDATVARRRLAFLEDAGRALSSPPDLEVALQEVARLAVPAIADWCVIYRVEADGAVHKAAIGHGDPARIGWVLEWEIGFPYDAHQRRGLSEVLSSGEPQLLREVPDELLVDAARSPEQLAALRQFGFTSCITVPLRGSGRVLGAIALVSADSGVRYGDEDLRLAEELARIVAAAMDNARLSEEVAGVVRERQQAAEGLRAIAARARCLLWYAEVEERRPGLHWRLRVADEEAARRFLPIEVPPGFSYGQALSEARLPEDRPRMAFGDEEMKAGRSYRQEFRVRDAEGHIRWLAEDVQVETIGPGHFYAVGVCVDVTERHQLEEALRLRAEALAEADRRKDEFLAMLAHELRNPLGAITNGLVVLQHPEASEAARRRALGVLDRQVRHQGRMVEDLLDVSRISRGLVELRLEPLDLSELVYDAVEDHRTAFRQAGVELELKLPEGPLPAVADRVRLAQVLGNLMSNALKFTPPGELVSISLESSDGEAAIRVRDTGIGIPAELLPHVFDSFTQGDTSLARSRGGLGLGLALVRGLVHLHAGTVAATSDGLGRGSEFAVLLPLTGVPSDSGVSSVECRVSSGPAPDDSLLKPRQPTTHHSPLTTRHSLRVLVVEDNRDAAETMRDVLELAGHTVEVARTGPAGIEAARRSPPDAVLCDIGLPAMDGYAVAAALRQDPLTAGARLIAISGYSQDKDRERSRAAGFDEHLVKPIVPERLYEVLASGSAEQPAEKP